MFKKVISYPAWMGPVKAWREANRIQKEFSKLPGYKELSREHLRVWWTLLFWAMLVTLGPTWIVIKVLESKGLIP